MRFLMAIVTIGVVLAMAAPELGLWLDVEVPGLLVCFCESSRVQ